ncbi:response regulator [Curtanaerobium respiraculi]|uniref:response regulator n=1 Tax=Curtanaerobium respiraculi TaxID=2949669 RepID=UPI0024B388A5|nr:response regulator [Curtanaerobium respiraculi]
MSDGHDVLVVEDDGAVRKLVTTALELHGYSFREATTGAQALMELSLRPPKVVLLDLGLPDMDGCEVISKVRSWSDLPIIVLSARLEDRDKVAALDAGADDYLVKPFSVEELLARLRVALRRASKSGFPEQHDNPRYANGPLEINFQAASVTLSGEHVHLTPIEYRLLCLMARNTGKVLTYNYILKEVWGTSHASEMSSLRVFMATLRKKIEPDSSRPVFLRTHVGIGYSLSRVD